MWGFVLKGGLGNQLFIYARARALHRKTGVRYYLTHLGQLSAFKLNPQERWWHLFKKTFFVLFLRARASTRKLDMESCWEDYSALIPDKKENLLIEGYFQGLHYFEEIQDDIRKELRLRKRYIRAYQEKIGQQVHAAQVSIAVHIRRTDYQNAFTDPELRGPDLTLPLSYYHSLIQELQDIPGAVFFFLSDDPEFAQKEFAYVANAVYCRFDPYTDLQVIMHADICVIANSTFSWWGAWLNAKPHKKIYAPAHFLGFKAGKDFPVRILPAEWITRHVG